MVAVPRNFLKFYRRHRWAYQRDRAKYSTPYTSHGKALQIFSNQGIINWSVKMNARTFDAFLMEFNFPEDQEFTRQELQQFHHLCRLRNLDMAPSNYNIWQSNIFLFHYLGKVSEVVPNLSI